MSIQKKRMADFLFIVQIAGASAFCGAYFIRSLTDVTGSSVVQFCQVAIYLVLSLSLSINAYKKLPPDAPKRSSKQLVATYAIWLVLMASIIGAVLTNPNYVWNRKETTMFWTAVALTIVVLGIVAIEGSKLSDPRIKAFFAIAYKSIPQVLLAWKFLDEGASGTPFLSIFVGHATILIRLAQIGVAIWEVGWKKMDRSQYWLLVSEGANEISWILATIAWVIKM